MRCWVVAALVLCRRCGPNNVFKLFLTTVRVGSLGQMTNARFESGAP